MNDESNGSGDAELLQAVGRADSVAFNTLTHRYARKCYGLAYKVLGNREMAEDTVQEVFLKIWTKPYMWQPDRGAKFSTWLYRVVSNASIDTYRRTRPVVSLENMQMEPADSRIADVHSMADLHRMTNLLKKVIANLPTNQRMALTLCRLEGMSYAETGEIMDVSAKAVDGYINRGINRLKKKLIGADVDIENILSK